MSEHEYTDRPRPRKWLLPVIVFGALCAGCAGAVAIGISTMLRLSGAPTPTTNLPGANSAAHSDNALNAEEQRVRAWIIDHEDDDKSVEFASWGPHDLKGEGDGIKTVRVRYRAKNGLGAMRLHDVLAYLSDHNQTVRVVDNYGGDNWRRGPVFSKPPSSAPILANEPEPTEK